MLNAIVALRYLGYSRTTRRSFARWTSLRSWASTAPNGEPDYPTPTFRMQPCFSPVWDTAQVLSTLGEAGLPRTIRGW
jgi:squalene-hopene/tetraprenyl-beta-curcumene cyclase